MVGALLLLLLSRSEKDRQSLVLPGNDDGGYIQGGSVNNTLDLWIKN